MNVELTTEDINRLYSLISAHEDIQMDIGLRESRHVRALSNPQVLRRYNVHEVEQTVPEQRSCAPSTTERANGGHIHSAEG